MSIETEMKALTAALTEHTAALNAFVKAGKGGSAGASTGSAGTTNKPKKITVDDVQAKFGGYLKVSDKDERAERLANVVKINKHFKVAKMSEADPKIWPDAFAMLDKFIAGEDPFASEDDNGDSGDDESVV